jgi:glycosyltransferase involved in cell wall biosynthesis
MEVTVALDARYAVLPDGSVWSQAGMSRQFWERYLEVFDSVRIVARAARVERIPPGWLPVTGPHIALSALPDYCGPWQCAKRYLALLSAVRAAAPAHGAVILRVGSQVANMLEGSLGRKRRPYGLEVVGDPSAVFAPGVVDHPLRRFFRWHFSRRLQRQCLRAAGVAFVTKRALQAMYPSRCPSWSVSDVDLPQEAAGRAGSAGLSPWVRKPIPHGSYRLVTVGSLAQHYKGTDVLIDAIGHSVRAGLDLVADIVGDGKYRRELMEQAERIGMATRIRFLGQVSSGDPVRRILDGADLFVLPSRTEGLPRALIEAMARGLPCIGSDVGGIPELLDAADLVPPGDPEALGRKIAEVLHDPLRMEAMSHRSLAGAREFLDPAVAERRRQFYRHIRDVTERWEAQLAAQ